jgi:hypothetical protein
MSKTRLCPVIALVLLSFSSIMGYAGCNIVFTENGHNWVVATFPYILSPANQTYNLGLRNLTVSFKGFIWGNMYFSMNYSLDGKGNQTIPLEPHYFGSFLQGDPDKNYWDGSTELPNLGNGSHCLAVYLEVVWETFDSSGSHNQTMIDSQTVNFAVSSPIESLMPQQLTDSSSTLQPHIYMSTTTPAANNEPTRLMLNSQTQNAVASVISILAITSVALVFFKRHNLNTATKRDKTS